MTIMCHVGYHTFPYSFPQAQNYMKQTFPNKTEIQMFGDEPAEGSPYIPTLFQDPEAFTS